MTIRFSLALLASTMFLAAPAVAQQASTDDIAALKAQISAMQQQIAELQAQQATQGAQVQQAQQDVAKIKVTPSKVADSASWANDTKIGGKAYFNASNISQRSDGAIVNQSGTQAELKRFYISVDHKFDKMFSANLTTDFRYGTNGTSKDVLVYVKKAFLQAKFSDALFARIGAADMPWIPFAEGVYGFRHIEQTLIDRTKYGTSSDWGIHLGGDLAGGKFSYAASAVNGQGYKTLSRSNKGIDLEGRVSAKPVDFITVGAGFYTGRLGKDVAGVSDTYHHATRLNALAAYTGKRATLGVEYFTAKNWKNVNTPSSDKTTGWSAFGSFKPAEKWAVFARYDWVNPDKVSKPALKEHYFNVGGQYSPNKNVDLALVYKRDKARNGTVSTGNGTIGGADGGTYDEFGLFGQFKF